LAASPNSVPSPAQPYVRETQLPPARPFVRRARVYAVHQGTRRRGGCAPGQAVRRPDPGRGWGPERARHPAPGRRGTRHVQGGGCSTLRWVMPGCQ